MNNLKEGWIKNGLNELIYVNAVKVERTKDGALRCLINKRALESALKENIKE